MPGASQAMVRINPVNGRGAVYAGAHASHVMAGHARKAGPSSNGSTSSRRSPNFVPRMRGRRVIWDNRATLHRATAYDTVRHSA